MNSHLWQAAAAFAASAHQHQMRKDGKTPYVSHTVRVAFTVACLFEHTDEKTLAAALLHDTIEDTGCDYEDIENNFGKDVADMVAALTKNMSLPEPQREVAYDKGLAAGPWQARLIKLADVYDNLCDMADDKSFRKQLDRIDRALKLAEGDQRLTPASNIVRDAAERVRKSMQ
jgi:guanosine-3',5'-bis(diphosphate) 3'-pyrophosphohydrolase